MGNCQAVESATVVIEHPSPAEKVERIYWSVSAQEIMVKNPGHYVALIVVSQSQTMNGKPMKQLKLLRPIDTLLIGQVYRLITFEDVLKEFAAKKCVKLGKLLKERGGFGGPDNPSRRRSDRPMTGREGFRFDQNYHRTACNSVKRENEIRLGNNNNPIKRHNGTSIGQWKPALQSIAEVETTSFS